MKLFDRIINPHLTVRRINISANHVVDEKQVQQKAEAEQLDLFVDYDALRQQEEKERAQLDKEKVWKECRFKGYESGGGSQYHPAKRNDWRS